MEALERQWRLWVTAIGAGLLLVIAGLGFVVLPAVESGGEGLNTFTAICRALGIAAATKPALPAAAPAQPESRVVWTAPEFAALARADAAAGKIVAEARCIACHAADGSSPDPTFPRLAGQSEFALYKELQDFKSGARNSPTMAALVQPLDGKQMAGVAVYYARLQPAALDAAPPSFAGSDIEALVIRGEVARALPPCAACHAANTGGPIATPTLTGQSPAYVTAQLKAFADGGRRNDVYARMRAIAAKLTPREMTLLGDYYATPH